TYGTPTVRDVGFQYPNDPDADAEPYEYMLGPDILVAPIWQEAQTTRTVHLPPGRWMHWFTGTWYDGGPTSVTVDAPLGTTPAFVREGALIPMLPDDVDTLVSVDAASGLVDDGDRPFLRAWSLPAASGAISTEEGIDLEVSATGGTISALFTPRA